jgi:ABC-type amino acid transport substrate-binding protein
MTMGNSSQRHRIGALQGPVFDSYARSAFANADVRQFNSVAAALPALETGQIYVSSSDVQGLRKAQKHRSDFVAIGEPIIKNEWEHLRN